MQNLCSLSLGAVARPLSNEIVCYYLNFVKKHLNNGEAVSMKSKLALRNTAVNPSYYRMLFGKTELFPIINRDHNMTLYL